LKIEREEKNQHEFDNYLDIQLNQYPMEIVFHQFELATDFLGVVPMTPMVRRVFERREGGGGTGTTSD
jgi:predicted acetyltransferase